MKNVFMVLLLLIPMTVIAESSLTDGEIKQKLIGQSIQNYSGSCPCPYSNARNGSRCGKRSAYSKPGGYEPLCYDEDVTDEMVERYRNRN